MENKVAWKKYSGQDLQALEQLCGEVSVSSQMEMIKNSVDVILQLKRLDGATRKVVEMWDIREQQYIE